MRYFLKRIINNAYCTFSQAGEDTLIKRVLDSLDISKPLYLDIGAHDPIFRNNTYLFYRAGGSGVLIEPDPLLFEKIKKKRRRDLCLNVGVSSETEDEADFFLMSASILNTFSREEAIKVQEETDQRITGVIKVKLVSINTILKKYFPQELNLLSLDIEGLDFDILKAMDFSIVRPDVICVETITYSEKRDGKKRYDIIDFLLGKNYFVYADTYINTIFVDRIKWEQ